MNTNKIQIAVIGLGYVGLPLAVSLSQHYPVIGFDKSLARINDLNRSIDRTNECSPTVIKNANIVFTTDISQASHCNIYIITVPTPVDRLNKPDLEAIILASETVSKVLEKNDVVVFESTVYPGVTEEVAGPVLEKGSGLVSGHNFFLGYSPERVNPGDKHHSVTNIPKVVSGQNQLVIEALSKIYGSINNNQVFIAKSIKVAEAAKVIENAQRDINIAFINEVTMIFSKMNIKTSEVLEVAKTKWNFLDFYPGLVGGHCIGVDPFYLAYAAREVGYNPEVILAGRKINDSFSKFLAEQIDGALGYKKKTRILILGLTFKENVPDLRNSKVFDLIKSLRDRRYTVDVHDPLASREEARQIFSIDLITDLEKVKPYDCIVGAVPHAQYKTLKLRQLNKLLKPRGLLADLKGIWRTQKLTNNFRILEL